MATPSLLLPAPLALLLVAGSAPASDPPRVLFLTHTAAFRHEVVTRPEAPGALSLAEAQLKEACRGAFEVEATQDCAAISRENLARFEAVVFYTTGELPFDDGQKEALLEFVRDGGGFVGIHSAADTFYEWPAYGELIGARFDGHPWVQKVRVRVEDSWHPSTIHLAPAFGIEDEIYQFKDWDRAKVHVLLSLDPDSVDLGAKGVKRRDRDFPLAWCREFGEGRVFYTALGHREELWRDPRFLTHVVEGIRWASRRDVDAEGFRPLLGRDRAPGWRQCGEGDFEVAEGVARLSGGPGIWWFGARRFENFLLRLEFARGKQDWGPLVLIGLSTPGEDPMTAGSQSASILSTDNLAGRLLTHGERATPDPSIHLRAPGEWNAWDIACLEGETLLRSNGRAASSSLSAPKVRCAGFLGLENDPQAGETRFRGIRVKELPANAASFRVLFEGDLSGWKMAGPGGFDIDGDALVSRGGMGLLWHEQPVRDFLLLLDWKVARREDNAGVFVRFPDPGDDPWLAVNKGYEIQICDTGGPKHRTGSIYDFQDSTSVPTGEPGTWNHMEILAVGSRYEVRVNGRTVNRFAGDRSLEGFVGLQNHDEASRVSFRNVRVVELRRE